MPAPRARASPLQPAGVVSRVDGEPPERGFAEEGARYVDVHSVIERVMQTYAGARLYTDRGTVVSALGGERQTIEFETAFERPDRFSFSFSFRSTGGRSSAPIHEHRIHADGKLVRLGTRSGASHLPGPSAAPSRA